jgi:hypothetical protein
VAPLLDVLRAGWWLIGLDGSLFGRLRLTFYILECDAFSMQVPSVCPAKRDRPRGVLPGWCY